MTIPAGPGREQAPRRPNVDQSRRPTWSTWREALAVCRYSPNRRRIAAIATVVGTVLVGVNQGSVLAAGRLGPLVWVRVGLDYLIPGCVSTMGVLAGSRRTGSNHAGAPDGAKPP